MIRAVAAAAFAMSAAGCAELPVFGEADPAAEFELAGRIAVRFRDEAASAAVAWRHGGGRDEVRGNDHLVASAAVAWRHGGGRDEVVVTSPVGQTVARIVREPGLARLEAADGIEHRATDVASLTERVLGFRLPLEHLVDWVRGRAGAGPAGIERDATGRPARIAQAGWVVEYLAWDADGRPARLRLVYPDLDLRLAIQRWGPP